MAQTLAPQEKARRSLIIGTHALGSYYPKLIEELGALATHIREADEDARSHNAPGSLVSLQDAMEAAGNLETIASELGAEIARLIQATRPQ